MGDFGAPARRASSSREGCGLRRGCSELDTVLPLPLPQCGVNLYLYTLESLEVSLLALLLRASPAVPVCQALPTVSPTPHLTSSLPVLPFIFGGRVATPSGAHFQLCALASFLADLGVPGFDPRSAACEASTSPCTGPSGCWSEEVSVCRRDAVARGLAAVFLTALGDTVCPVSD